MIKRLETKNFTVFRNATLEFSPDLNVFIGENGTGKTHLLKLLYSILACYGTAKCSSDGNVIKQQLQQNMADKLIGVFRPNQLGRLTTRKQGRERTEIKFFHKNSDYNCEFSFATISKSEVNFSRLPGKVDIAAPVYFPAKEILTLYPKCVSMYDDFHLQYDETYRSTMLLLGRSYLKGPHEKKTNELIQELERTIGGHIYLDRNGDSFYMSLSNEKNAGGEMEINLVAEGWRKLGMLTQVVLNGALKDKGFLFWDEPEANLNPRLIKVLAKSIFLLSLRNIQVFITTHSLFLLRELEYLSHSMKKKDTIRYFCLHANGDIEQSYCTAELQDIASFEEEVAQEERIINYSGE